MHPNARCCSNTIYDQFSKRSIIFQQILKLAIRGGAVTDSELTQIMRRADARILLLLRCRCSWEGSNSKKEFDFRIPVPFRQRKQNLDFKGQDDKLWRCDQDIHRENKGRYRLFLGRSAKANPSRYRSGSLLSLMQSPSPLWYGLRSNFLLWVNWRCVLCPRAGSARAQSVSVSLDDQIY